MELYCVMRNQHVYSISVSNSFAPNIKLNFPKLVSLQRMYVAMAPICLWTWQVAEQEITWRLHYEPYKTN